MSVRSRNGKYCISRVLLGNGSCRRGCLSVHSLVRKARVACQLSRRPGLRQNVRGSSTPCSFSEGWPVTVRGVIQREYGGHSFSVGEIRDAVFF